MAISNLKRRNKIKKRIRKVISGTSDRPRLSVFRSNKGIYAQIVDDTKGFTLVAASYKDKEIQKFLEKQETTKMELAVAVGKLIAEKSIAKNIKKVSFDRNGFLYHGRIKSLADAARASGLEF